MLKPHPICYLSANPFQFVNAFPEMEALMLSCLRMHNSLAEGWHTAVLAGLCSSLVDPGTSHEAALEVTLHHPLPLSHRTSCNLHLKLKSRN